MTDNNTQKTANAYIVEFREGVDFHRGKPISGLIRNNQVDKSSLSILSKELRNGTAEVRENIVRLLEAVALTLSSNDIEKLPTIKDRSIIQTLLIDGFAKQDSARQLAGSALLKKCRPTDLAAFDNIFLASLKNEESSYLQLVAKAKTLAAKPYVDKLAKDPFWSENPSRLKVIKITQAALGDKMVESQFINAVRIAEEQAPSAPKNSFYDVGDARDGIEVAKQLSNLGLIGTRESLSVTCKYLRSPLKSFVGAGEKSVRYTALDAIHYNYPDERALRNPLTRNEWQAAEEFCTEHIGVVFDGPTPNPPDDAVIPSF